jgi:hypothetical protein
LNYRNIKHIYLRAFCQVGLNRNKYSFFFALWVLSWFV